MTMPPATAGYQARRGEIGRYFDRTAADAWMALTSDTPLGRIRASVRAGRARMADTLLDWLPADLTGCRVLDAGCGTGSLALTMAGRGAAVVAIDLSPTLIEHARERAGGHAHGASVEFRSGDMLADGLGDFDYVVAMDSLIHYPRHDVLDAVATLAPRVGRALLFTCVPWSPLLAAKRTLGRCFPRTERAPDVRPIHIAALQRSLRARLGDAAWLLAGHRRISSGFYTSDAMCLERR